MATLHPNYDAYLLRTWREEPVREALPPTCYYLVEQLFGARQGAWGGLQLAIKRGGLMWILTVTQVLQLNQIEVELVRVRTLLILWA